MSRSLVAAVLAALALPASALADPAGSTLLQSRPSGLGVLPQGSVNESFAGTRSVSADGCRVVFASGSDGLSTADDDRRTNVFLRDRCAGTTRLVTTTYNGRPWNSSAGVRPAISPNGRFVIFTGSAQHEVTGAPGSAWYRLDLDEADPTQARTVMTRSGSTWAEISQTQGAAVADNGTVAFVTRTSLVPSVDNNGGPDAYATADGQTFILASRVDGASGSVGGGVTSATISGDGSTVGFVGGSTLVAADKNGSDDAYVRQGDATILVSRPTDPDGLATGGVTDLDLDADGTVAAFVTNASVDAADTNAVSDVYRRSGTATTLVSRADAVGNASSARPSVSADGAVVAFESLARNLVTPAETGAVDWDVFVADAAAGTVSHVSRVGAAGELGTGSSSYASLSGDGSTVAFQTRATNLLTDDPDDFQRIVSRTLATGATQLVSRPDGDAPFAGELADAGPDAAGPVREAISADGRFMLFLSRSDSLSDADDDAVTGAYVRDNRTDTTTFASRADGAAGAPVHASVEAAALSDDGRHVAFVTSDALEAADTDATRDVYVRDLAQDTTTLASPGTADGVDPDVSISGDGGEVAFTTLDALTPADVAGYDVYVMTLGAAPRLVSTGDGHWGAHPSLDGDGSHVAFQTTRGIDAADGNGEKDVYVRPVAGGDAVLASRRDGPDGAVGTHESTEASLSADGAHVAFTSVATNLSPADASTERSVYVRDLAGEETVLASRAPGSDGAVAGGYAYRPAISGDGERVAFVSNATNLADDLAYSQRVWLRDLATHATTMASRADGTAPGGASIWADRPAISASGSCVGFLATGAGIAPAYPVGDHGHAYLRVVDGECPDETTPQTTIDGGPGSTTDDTTPTFTFSSDDERATFTCSVDGGAAAPCSSPHTLGTLAEGAHTLSVVATDAAGNVDATAATRAFTVDVPDPPVQRPDPGQETEDDRPVDRGSVVIAPEPTNPTPRAAVQVVGRTLKVARSGWTKLRLACSGAPCAGTVQLKARIGRRTVVIGRGRYAAQPGATAAVTLKLTAAGRKALRRKLKATLAVSGAAPLKVTLKR